MIYAPRWALPGMRFRITRVGNIPCIDLWSGERSLLGRQLKRFLGLIVVGLGLLLISPLLLLIALAATPPVSLPWAGCCAAEASTNCPTCSMCCFSPRRTPGALRPAAPQHPPPSSASTALCLPI